MQRNVDVLVLTTVNQCHRTALSVGTLLDILNETRATGAWMPHMAQFFSDVPVGAMSRFCACHHIAPSTLRKYYESYIRPLGDRSPVFERWVYGDVGTPV